MNTYRDVLAAVCLWLGLLSVSAAQEEPKRVPHTDAVPASAQIRLGTTKLRGIKLLTEKQATILPDGKHLLISNGTAVNLWNLETGFLEKTIVYKSAPKYRSRELEVFGQIRNVAPTLDRTALGILMGGGLYLAPNDFASPAARTKVILVAAQIAVGFAKPAGAEVAVLLDVAGRVDVQKLDATREFGNSVYTKISKAKHFVTTQTHCAVAATEGSAALIDLRTKKIVARVAEKRIEDVAVSADERTLAICCNKDELLLYDLQRNEQIGGKRKLPNTWSIALSPDGQRLLRWGYADRLVELRDLKTEKTLFANGISGTGPPVLIFAEDGKRCYAIARSGTLHIWDAESGKSLTSAGHTDAISSVKWTSADTLASSSLDGTIRLWQVKDGKEIHRLNTKITDGVYHFDISKDRRNLYYATSDTAISAWDLANQRALPSFGKEIDGRLTSFAISPDGKTIASGIGSEKRLPRPLEIQISTVEKEPKIRAISLPDEFPDEVSVAELLFTRNDLLISRNNSGKTRIWDLKKGEVLHEFKFNNPIANLIHVHFRINIVVTPDQKFLITPERDSTQQPTAFSFWEIATGKRTKQMPGGDFACTTLALTSDGKTLIAGDASGAIHLWNVETGERLRHERGHRGAVTAISISPDGRSFASGSTDTSIVVWNLLNSQKK